MNSDICRCILCEYCTDSCGYYTDELGERIRCHRCMGRGVSYQCHKCQNIETSGGLATNQGSITDNDLRACIRKREAELLDAVAQIDELTAEVARLKAPTLDERRRIMASVRSGPTLMTTKP